MYGYDRYGYDKDGYDEQGFNRAGVHMTEISGKQESKLLDEKEARLQELEQEAETISEAEKLVEQRNGKTEEHGKDE